MNKVNKCMLGISVFFSITCAAVSVICAFDNFIFAASVNFVAAIFSAINAAHICIRG